MSETYIVGFLDVLGFGKLLTNKEYSKINELFNKIADTITFRLVRSVLAGLDNFQPVFEIFSDSIIIYNQLFSITDNRSILNTLIFQGFHQTIANIIADLLLIGIPIRGGMAINSLFIKQAHARDYFRNKEIGPKKIVKTGEKQLLQKFVFNEESGKMNLEYFDKKPMPFTKFKSTYGPALTEAYFLGKDNNFIGVLVEPSIFDHRLLQTVFISPIPSQENINESLRMNSQRKLFVKLTIKNREYYAINWNRKAYISDSDLIKLNKRVEQNINDPNNTADIKSKWIALSEFFKHRML